MNYGYIYEIQRKSDEFEGSAMPQQQRTDLRSFSEEEDDEIWEVPEDNFDNAYQTIDETEDDGSVESDVQQKAVPKRNPSNVLQNFEIFSAQRLRLSLSAEQISLRTQQQQWENTNHKSEVIQREINKSINTEVDGIGQTRPVVVNSSSSCLSASTTNDVESQATMKWKNVKINSKTNDNENISATTNLSAANIPLIPLILTKATRKLQNETNIEREIKRNLYDYPIMNGKRSNNSSYTVSSIQNPQSSHKFALGSITSQQPHIDLGPEADYGPSPESVIDNVLSNASSVSVQSSSLSSGILTDNTEELQHQGALNPFRITDDYAKRKLFENKIEDDYSKQLESKQPLIKITGASSSTSTSTLNNGRTSRTSTESYETAINASGHPSTALTDALVVHASSPEPLQYPDDLLCQICHDTFKDPRCLNCLHTFCLQCIVNENFKADECTNIWSKFDMKANEAEYKTKAEASVSSTSSTDCKTESTKSDVLATTPKIRSSFSFKLRRSSESPIKSKMDNSRILNDNTTTPVRIQTQTNCYSRKISCKICHKVTDVPAGGIRQLPQNCMMIRKMHEFQFKITDSGKSCSLCFDETNASYYCKTCSINLCTLCKESHARQKTTVNHDIKEIENNLKLKTAANESGVILKCNLHQGFDVKSFCTTCLQVACSDCLILQHKGHKYEAIPKASQCYGRILRDSTEQARLVVKTTEYSLNKLNEYSEHVIQKCDLLREEVEDFMKRYIQAVEAHKWALLRQIDEARGSKLSMISQQQVEIEKHNQETLTAIAYGQELTDVASDVELLSFVKIMLKRFEHLQQFKSPIDAKLNNTPHFVPKIQASPSQDHTDITVFGIITSQIVEPSQCTLQWNGFSQLRLHKKVVLTLISKDADGLPITHGGLKIQSHVKYKDVNSKCLRMEIGDNNDGTYSIAFTPDSEGTIILMITINEKHIKGSPFSFLSRPVRPHTGIYHCCTFCSSKGNKFATCSCDGHMPGYSGCGHGHTGHPGHRHWSCCGDVLRNSECQFSNRSLNPK